MSDTSPADKDESEAEIVSTPNVKLAGILQDESVTDGSTLELDSKSLTELISGGLLISKTIHDFLIGDPNIILFASSC